MSWKAEERSEVVDEAKVASQNQKATGPKALMAVDKEGGEEERKWIGE